MVIFLISSCVMVMTSCAIAAAIGKDVKAEVTQTDSINVNSNLNYPL